MTSLEPAPTPSLTVDELSRIGIAMFGTEEWKAGLAKALQTNKRTVQRWSSGAEPIPEWLREDLIEIMGARRSAIAEVLRQLVPTPPKQSGFRALCQAIDAERQRLAGMPVSTVYDDREAWLAVLAARDEVEKKV